MKLSRDVREVLVFAVAVAVTTTIIIVGAGYDGRVSCIGSDGQVHTPGGG